MMEIDRKSCFSVKKIISTSKQHAEHSFAGRNSQHKCDDEVTLFTDNEIEYKKCVVKCFTKFSDEIGILQAQTYTIHCSQHLSLLLYLLTVAF